MEDWPLSSLRFQRRASMFCREPTIGNVLKRIVVVATLRGQNFLATEKLETNLRWSTWLHLRSESTRHLNLSLRHQRGLARGNTRDAAHARFIVWRRPELLQGEIDFNECFAHHTRLICHLAHHTK